MDGREHAWIKITSNETGLSIYVDDGFVGDLGKVHTAPPKPKDYDYKFVPKADGPRDKCNIPKAVNSQGNPVVK